MCKMYSLYYVNFLFTSIPRSRCFRDYCVYKDKILQCIVSDAAFKKLPSGNALNCNFVIVASLDEYSQNGWYHYNRSGRFREGRYH